MIHKVNVKEIEANGSDEVYLLRTGQQRTYMANTSTNMIVWPQKIVNQVKLSFEVKLQQSMSLQQQLVKCNNCNKYFLKKLEKTMKRKH